MRIRNTSSSVLRRTSTDSGREPSAWSALTGGVAVVGVDQRAVGQHLDAGAWPASGRERELDVDAVREAHLDDLTRDVAGDQLARRPLVDDAARRP